MRKDKEKFGWKIDVSYVYGIYIVTPEGERVAQATGRGVVGVDARVNTSKHLASFLDRVAEKAGNPKPRELSHKRTNRFAGLNSDGSVRMPVCVRERGKFGRPMFDSVHLTSQQIKSMAPSDFKVGTRYSIPPTTAQQFSPILTYDSCSTCKIYADNVTASRMDAEVTAVTKDKVEIRLTGKLSGIGKQTSVSADGEFEGRMIFNGEGNLLSFLLVHNGKYHGGLLGKFHSNGMPVQGIVEWAFAKQIKGNPKGRAAQSAASNSSNNRTASDGTRTGSSESDPTISTQPVTAQGLSLTTGLSLLQSSTAFRRQKKDLALFLPKSPAQSER